MAVRLSIGSLITLGILAAACTGDDAGTRDSTVPPDTPDSAAVTTTPPTTAATTGTGSPLPTTTTLPPGLQPQEISSGLRPGTLATYEGTLETGIDWSGAEGVELLVSAGVADGSRISQWSGRQRLLALEAGDATELIEDFIAQSGTIITERGGERETVEPSRDELLDFKPFTPPVLIDGKNQLVEDSPSGAPAAFATEPERLAATALVGPPLPAGEVDVGSSWTVEYEGGLLGPITIEAEIVDESEIADGVYHFVIEYTGTAVDLSESLDLEAAFALTIGLGEGQRLRDLLLPGASGSVTVTSAALQGRVLFDPERNVASEFESNAAIAMDLIVDAGGETVTLEVEAHAGRSFVLDEVESAAPFQVESVLDRFEIDPSALASSVFDRLAVYEIREATNAEVGSVLEPLLDVRQDLFAGAAIFEVADGEGGAALAASITTGGSFRGAPFVGEEVAAFLSGSRPDDVSIGDRTAFRVTIEDEEWLLYNNETHLLITIGPRDTARRVMADLAASFSPYLWQPGDCLDFTDDFDGATPYAPYGLHGLKHCDLEHTHQVIHSEALPEGPDAGFPTDLNERSDATCGRAFYEFTGTTELESALALTRYRPDEDEWDKGSRYFACVVSLGTSDSLTTVEGRIDGRDPELVFDLEVGTCLLNLTPVECDDLHNGEIIAAFEVPGGPDAPRPDQDEQRAAMRERCESTFSEFELGEGPGSVQVVDITDVFTAWEAGARDYYCLAQAFDEVDGFRLDITGTFSAGWEEAEERVAA